MNTLNITAERLREVLNYDPNTGLFTWRVAVGRKIVAGKSAGCVDKKSYLRVRIDGCTYKAHRLAWLYVYGKWPLQEVDHIDGDRLNNRIGNLRDVSRAKNNQNKRDRQSNNTSGFRGVTYCKRINKHKAEIRANGQYYYLGFFDTPEEASAAYIGARRVLHPHV